MIRFGRLSFNRRIRWRVCCSRLVCWVINISGIFWLISLGITAVPHLQQKISTNAGLLGRLKTQKRWAKEKNGGGLEVEEKQNAGGLIVRNYRSGENTYISESFFSWNFVLSFYITGLELFPGTCCFSFCIFIRPACSSTHVIHFSCIQLSNILTNLHLFYYNVMQIWSFEFILEADNT